MRRLLALWLLALLGLGLAACDDGEDGGTSAQDGPLGADAAQDAAQDANRPDARVRDRGPDAALPRDRGPDGDLPADAAVDRGPDAAADGGGPDAGRPDGGGPPDAGADATLDAGADAAADAAPDAALPDLAPPLDQGEALSLVVDAPPEGALTNRSPIEVRGRVDRLATVRINDVEAPVEGGRFAQAVPLAEGPNALRVVATAGDETAETTVNVVLDTEAPVVAWVAPAPGTVTNQAALTVRGTVDDATAAVTVNGAAVPLAQGVFETRLVLAEGPNTLVAEAQDAAGNRGRAEVVVTFDPSAPTLVVTQPLEGAALPTRQVTVAGTAEGAGVAVTVDGAPAPLVGGAFAVVLNRPEGPQSVTVVARNPAGSESRVVRAFRVDTVAPGVVIRSPAVGARLIRERTEVTGNLDEPAAVTVNGVEATVTGLTFRAVDVPLVEGANTLVAVATDAAGNVGQAEVAVTVDTQPPAITLTEPEDGLTVSGDSVAVSGQIDPSDVVSVEVNGLAVPFGADGRFTAPEVPVAEGRTLVTAIATDASGNVGFVTVRVYRDTKPPMVRIETPQDGDVLNLTQVDVAGITNDLVAGVTVGEEDVRIFVNGVPAQVQNRTFVLPELLLQLGPNVITVEAVDAAGNRATRSIRVTVDPSAGQRIVQISGAGQTAALGQALARPLVVSLLGANGDPVPHTEVVFEVSRGDGALVAFPERGREVRVTTDENGLASVGFEPGGRAGAGSHRVVASAPGFVGRVEFCTSVRSGVPVRIKAVTGDNLQAQVGRAMAEAFVGLVVDEAGNPVTGARVRFTVDGGAGVVDGVGPVADVVSDSDGLVRATLTPGPTPGLVVVVASLAEVPEAEQEDPATFRARVLQAGARDDTRIVGTVLDNSDLPIAGVTAWLRLPDGPVLSARTDALGRFAIDQVPVGNVHLVIDGSTADGPDTWPSLQIDIVTVAGEAFDLGTPIYLPRMDVAGAAVVGGAEDVTLAMAGVPGAELTVFGGSVRCPDDAPTCSLTWSQVRAERVPDPPPLGSNFSVVWTLQPANVAFDPPARVCVPNEGHPPGTQLELFSFDHDLADWVGLGTATVSEDGARACSDEGFGIFKSGWGGAPPPPPPPTCAGGCNNGNRCQTGRCVRGQCQYTNKADGTKCDDGSGCGVAACAGGSCVFSSTEEDGSACDDANVCTENDACSGGACQGDQRNCDDSVECTRDTCHRVEGCKNEPQVGRSCDDGDACTERDQCDQGGACAGETKECEQDDNPCTEARCDPANGACAPEPVNEGNPCGDQSDVAQCGEYVCTAGACEPGEGEGSDGQECDDEDACTEEDKCEGGQCKGTPLDTSSWSDASSAGFDLKLPDGLLARINGVFARVPGLDRIRFNEATFGARAKAKDCCNEEQGVVELGTKEGEGTLTLKASLVDVPIGPWALNIDRTFDFGIAEVDVLARVGPFWNADVGFSGSVGGRIDACNDDGNCAFGNVGLQAAFNIKLLIEAIVCLETLWTSQRCRGITFQPIGVSASAGGNVGWNRSSCDEGTTLCVFFGKTVLAAELSLDVPGGHKLVWEQEVWGGFRSEGCGG